MTRRRSHSPHGLLQLTNIKCQPVNRSSGGLDGERKPLRKHKHGNRTRGRRDARRRNPLGNKGQQAKRVGNLNAGEAPLRFADIAERFGKNTRNRFKPGSETPAVYLRRLRRLWEHQRLESLTKQRIAGKGGKEAILSFMATVPLPSRRFVLAALECTWTMGLELAWPIDLKRDFGRTLPPIGNRETPPDEDIRPWADAVQKEPDPFTKLLVLMLLQFGWRPENQIGHLRWRNVRYENGRPYAIVARGAVESFKSPSDIVAWLPSDVAAALVTWKETCPSVSPETYVLTLDGDPASRGAIGRRLVAFERRWKLKHLAPCLFRHWVKTTCRGLSDPALAALQGHKPPRDSSMRNTYDTPSIERILDEQATEFPDGPLGIFKAPQVTVAPELQEEMRAVADWKAGKLSLLKLMELLEAMQRKPVDLLKQ